MPKILRKTKRFLLAGIDDPAGTLVAGALGLLTLAIICFVTALIGWSLWEAWRHWGFFAFAVPLILPVLWISGVIMRKHFLDEDAFIFEEDLPDAD